MRSSRQTGGADPSLVVVRPGIAGATTERPSRGLLLDLATRHLVCQSSTRLVILVKRESECCYAAVQHCAKRVQQVLAG
jgi:hypothetical protein